MKYLAHLAFLASVQFAVALAYPSSWTIGQTVHTTSGPVDGHAAPNTTGVSEYLGIPYAQPPVGRLRFQPPVRYNGTEKIDGKNFGYSCMASNISSNDDKIPESLIKRWGITDVGLEILSSFTRPSTPFSEDCLTLNVWTKPQTGERKKAVMIWIYGGSFVSGSSSDQSYNGKYFADQEDVVLVTINYRLTIFGFPGNPLGGQNLGLLDQRLAVEWVRDNIAAFGGDPSRITIFGESAGGVSVDYYTYAWSQEPIVSGVIAQSGTAAVPVRSPELAQEFWFNASAAVGCGNASAPAEKVLECMMAKPAKEIVRGLVNTMDSTTSLPYGPTVDNKIVFSNYTGVETAKVSMLIGTMDNENGLFKVFVDEDVPPEVWQKGNLELFECPAAARAALSVKQGNPTWRYRYFGVFPNMILTTRPPSGAYHSSEIPVLFDTVRQNRIANTEEENAIGRSMRGAWAAFAKDPVHGLQRYEEGWPRYVANKSTLLRIGYENRTGPNLGIGNMYDGGCKGLN